MDAFIFFIFSTFSLWNIIHCLPASGSEFCPTNCACANSSRHVTCEGAGLQAFPTAAELPGHVTVLDLTRNSIHVVNPSSFQSLHHLHELRLRENSISGFLRRGTFDAVASTLEILDLSRNNLTAVEPGAFGLPAESLLIHLDLSGNRISRVEVAFDGMRQLSRLDLRQNSLTTLTALTLSGLTGLRYLRLDDNHISNIDGRAFLDLERLTYLVLRGNPLGAVEKFQFSSPFLSYVDMSECELERVPRGFPSSVSYLQLRRNHIRSLDRAAVRDFASSLGILVLDENRLERVDDGALESATKLQQLWLNGNRLRAVPRPLPPNVERLFLDSNELEKLTADDFPTSGSRLSTLSIMANNVSFVAADAFARLNELRTVDMSANRIRKILTGTFSGNTRLKSVSLSKNPLEELEPRCFSGGSQGSFLQHLETLSVTYVQTVSVVVDPTAFGTELPGLRTLDLDNSPALIRSVVASDSILSAVGSVSELGLVGAELESLRADFPAFFPRLVDLRVSGTRWRCDASVAWLRNWLLSADIRVQNPERNVCDFPASLRGRPITSLSNDEIPPPAVGGAAAVVSWTRRAAATDASPAAASTVYLSTLSIQSSTSGRPPRIGELSKASDIEDRPLTWEEVLNRMYQLQHPSRSDVTVGSPTTAPSTTKFRWSTMSSRRIRSTAVISTSAGLPPSLRASSALTSSRVLTIVVMTVLVTLLAAAGLLILIVYICRKQQQQQQQTVVLSQKQTRIGNGISATTTTSGGNVAKRRSVVYFVASHKRPTVVTSTVTEATPMTSLPVATGNGVGGRSARDVTPHESTQLPMRVYKWEDF